MFENYCLITSLSSLGVLGVQYAKELVMHFGGVVYASLTRKLNMISKMFPYFLADNSITK